MYKVIQKQDWSVLVLEGLHIGDMTIVTSKDKGLLDVVASYLNEVEKTYFKWREATKDILIASLTGKQLNVTQEKVAKMLGYPDLTGFIKETFIDPKYPNNATLVIQVVEDKKDDNILQKTKMVNDDA